MLTVPQIIAYVRPGLVAGRDYIYDQSADEIRGADFTRADVESWRETADAAHALARRVARAEAFYATAEAEGVMVQGFAGRWSITTAARASINGAYTSAVAAIELEFATSDGPFPLTDINYERHTFTLAQLKTFGVLYAATVTAVEAQRGAIARGEA